jgi:hypothetical protein
MGTFLIGMDRTPCLLDESFREAIVVFRTAGRITNGVPPWWWLAPIITHPMRKDRIHGGRKRKIMALPNIEARILQLPDTHTDPQTATQAPLPCPYYSLEAPE